MGLFRKLFAGRGSDAYHQGVALLEDGRAGEAVPLLRTVFEQDPGSPRGSLAGYYLRQALVSEGRRLLGGGDAAGAADVLAEAARHWPDFPDLVFLAGTARGLAGAWDGALDDARAALRRNRDYCEARLLEACALQQLGRDREAADSLDALVESGRRVDHALARDLAAQGGYAAATLPDDLPARLRITAVGDDAKTRLAGAVAECRAGRWSEGLARFAELAAAYPRYPDIRAKQAAALYQAGRSDEALEAAEAALALNDRYRTAVALRGLILAEKGRIAEAHDDLAEAVPRLAGTAGRHEELFLAYLRSTLALLLGRPGAARELLEGWSDLPRQFARAELLLAAADHLEGKLPGALRRLEELCEIWTGDAELHALRAALLLEARQWSAVEDAIARWPAGRTGGDDPRALWLRARLAVAQDRTPPPLPAVAGPLPDEPVPFDEVHPAAWRQLASAEQLLAGDAATAVGLLRGLLDAGWADEETGRLLLRACAASGERPPADLAGRIGAADSWAVALCSQLRLQGEGAAAEELARRRAGIRPERSVWCWLSSGFWLEPVRRWIA
jgi:tetratricopeptide (TPR) repeat protein